MNKTEQNLFKIENAPRLAQRRVWLNWLGLHLAGYELWQPVPVLLPVLEKVKGLRGAEALKPYFLRARMGLSDLNPWWPGASALSAAAYFCADDLGSIDMDAYLGSERANAAHSSWREQGFLSWIQALPEKLNTLSTLSGLEAALRAVEVYVAADAASRQAALHEERELIAGFLDGETSSQSLYFLPNPLQAWQLTDQVRKPSSLTVIATQVRPGSFLHEFLHGGLEGWRDEIAAQIKIRGVEGFLDLNLLRAQGYAWEGEAVPGARAFEEGLVRAVSIAVQVQSNKAYQSALEHLARAGFHFVRKLQDLAPEELRAPNLRSIIQKAFN